MLKIAPSMQLLRKLNLGRISIEVTFVFLVSLLLSQPLSHAMNSKSPKRGMTIKRCEAVLGIRLNQPALVSTGKKGGKQFTMFDYFPHDPSLLLVEEHWFRGSLMETKRITIVDTQKETRGLLITVKLETTDKWHETSEDTREYRLTEDRVELVKGPLGMAGLMYAAPHDGLEFTDFAGQVHGWEYLGDWKNPRGEAFKDVFILTGRDADGKRTESFYAPGIGEFYFQYEDLQNWAHLEPCATVPVDVGL